MTTAGKKVIKPGKYYVEFGKDGYVALVFYEESFRQLLGYEAEAEYANTQDNWLLSIHPDDVARVKEHFAECIGKHPKGMDFDIEYRIMMKTGYRWVHDYANIIRWHDGSPMRGHGVVFDIDEAVRSQGQEQGSQLEEALDKASREQQRNDFLYDIMNATKWSCDINAADEITATHYSEGVYEQTQTHPEGEPMDWAKYIYPDDKDRVMEAFMAAVKDRSGKTKYDVTFRILGDDGKIRWIKTAGRTARRSDGSGEIYGMNVDLTEQIEKEQENNRRMLALEDNFEALYDVELDTGRYGVFIKGKSFSEEVQNRLENATNYFVDLRANVPAVVYPDDQEELYNLLTPKALRRALAEQAHIDHFYRVMIDNEPVWFKIRATYKDSVRHNVIIGVFNAEAEVAARKQAEEDRKALIAQMNGGESLYIVNPVTEKFQILSQNEYLSANYTADETYTESVTRYINADVFAPDKKMVMEAFALATVVSGLEHKNEYMVQYRDISSSVPRWYEMRAVKLSDSEILVGFADKDNEIILEHLDEQERAEDIALLAVDLDNGSLKIIKNNPWDDAYEVGEVVPYSEFISHIGERYDGEVREFFDKIGTTGRLRRILAQDYKHTYSYRSAFVDGEKWINLSGYVVARNADGRPSAAALCFSLLDTMGSDREEMQEKIAESLTAVSKEKNRYDVLHEIIKSGQWSFSLNAADEIVSTYFSDSMETIIDNDLKAEPEFWKQLVHPDDLPGTEAAFAAMIADHSGRTPFDVNFRMIDRQGNYNWFRGAGRIVRQEDGSGEFFGIHVNINQRVEEEQQRLLGEKAEIELQHEQLRSEVLNFMMDNDDPVKLLKNYAEQLWVLTGCDQVVYRDLEQTRMTLNSPAIGKDWSVPDAYCLNCSHFNAYHPMYAEGYVEIENCQENGQDAAVYEKCPLKSLLTRILYCDGKIAGYLSINYVRDYHQFTDIERSTVEEFSRILSIALSRYAAREENKELKLTMALKESEKIIKGVAADYSVVYMVNMSDDSFRLLRMDEGMLGRDETFPDFSAAKEYFISTAVYELDRDKIRKEMDYDTIRQKLGRTSSYGIPYRTIVNKTVEWYEMRITRIDADQVVFGFSEKTEEIIAKIFSDKLIYKYDALYLVDLNNNEIRPVRPSRVSQVGAITQKTEYVAMTRKFAETVEPKYRKDWINFSNPAYMKRYMADEDKREYIYELSGLDKKIRRFTVEVLERINGEATMLLYAFEGIDDARAQTIRMQVKMAEQKVLLDYFMESYSSAYTVNLLDDSFEILHMEGEASHKFVMGGNREDMLKFIDEHIHPDDRAVMLQNIDKEYVINRLREKNSYTFIVREIFGLVEKTMRCLILRCPDEYHIAVGFMDISEAVRKEQEQQKKLAAALESAEVANKSKTSFLFNMSHDIRTPMNAITGFTTMAKKYLGDKEKVDDYLNKIDVSGQQLLRLVNQVLEMSRIESGRIELEEEPVNVRDEFEPMVIILGEQAKEKGLEFNYFLSNIKHFNLLADKARVGQITLNIAGNALKYTMEGGRIDFTLKEIPCEREGYARFVFTVADTGIGMSREYLKELFEPFSREKSTTVSHIQGTGLGMSIVKKLIDLMGGTIEVQSELGKGSRFDITIDFKIDENAADKQSGTEEIKEVAPVAFAGKRVLLVEDNELNREIAKDILEEFGLTVEEAEDGDVAVDMVKQTMDRGECKYYDLVLMDIQMPNMNGYDATRAIRAIEEPLGSHLPIIAMTANAFAEDRKNALAAGMDGHLAKPIELDRLLETLARVL